MIRVFLEGVGLLGPALESWATGAPILAGARDYVPGPTRVVQSMLLPPNERRRSPQTVKLALSVGAEAFEAAGRPPDETPTVFTSSGGDGETIHEILSVLASNAPELSPTRFHNSVHNTPAGYWGIATGSRAPSSSLCCHDGSFVAGLLEAATQATAECTPVALICYDVQYPEPLNRVRPIGAPFAVAFVMTPDVNARSFACFELTLDAEPRQVSVMTSGALEALRQNTPAARSLPLLSALARQAQTTVVLPYLDSLTLSATVAPLAPLAPQSPDTKAMSQ